MNSRLSSVLFLAIVVMVIGIALSGGLVSSLDDARTSHQQTCSICRAGKPRAGPEQSQPECSL